MSSRCANAALRGRLLELRRRVAPLEAREAVLLRELGWRRHAQ